MSFCEDYIDVCGMRCRSRERFRGNGAERENVLSSDSRKGIF